MGIFIRSARLLPPLHLKTLLRVPGFDDQRLESARYCLLPWMLKLLFRLPQTGCPLQPTPNAGIYVLFAGFCQVFYIDLDMLIKRKIYCKT